MRVSFNQAKSPRVKDTNGYGYAAKLCKSSLADLGHEVTWRDDTADVEINFIQPDHWYWTGPYRIGYVPWESTAFPDGWVEKMNNECDELWTPSPVIARWMVAAGVTKDVKIYQHGVESVWEPIERSPGESINVLHHGAEALRKGGREALLSFLEVLGDTGSVFHLKMLLERFEILETPRVKVHCGKVSIEELTGLYHDSHLFLYPSWGEGFGLTPLQAMATGMPVLITKGWAPYEHLLPEEMLIETSLTDSPWQAIHPGQMLKPDLDDLNDKLRNMYENLPQWTDWAYAASSNVHQEYNWQTLTRDAFAHLVT